MANKKKIKKQVEKVVLKSVEVKENTSVYKIENHLPFPARRCKFSEYPYLYMHVGDSFFVEGGKYSNLHGMNQTALARKIGVFRSREVTEGMKKGVRTWRVE